jgi:hypothetical protein
LLVSRLCPAETLGEALHRKPLVAAEWQAADLTLSWRPHRP